ncbi:MAG: uroporphyrinogen-III C-methyltransferase [Candidatus Binatia bacterium]
MSGRVYLVGAGPGDPGLLTLRGRDVLARADVVLYDALANIRLLGHAPASAEKRQVGKRHGRDSVAQEDIETLMVARALEGKTVVRLKGGDPFIFGRGGEEAEACRAAGIAFEVIPGVTSAIGVPAYAGIPLTHREHSSLVTFVTGQSGSARPGYDVDWAALARTGGTLVFLMAMTRIGEIAARLIEAGMSPQTPVAGIRWGTLPRQKRVLSTLARIEADSAGELVRPPVIFVVGEVAGLAEDLGWYERLALFGRRIVVTRARHQAAALAERLERSGAEIVEFPTIEVRELAIAADVFDTIGSWDWLVLTSVNGVDAFFGQLLASGRDLRELAGVKLAAIGPATRAAIESRGLRVAAQPSEYRAEALLEALGDVQGQRVLLARAEVAREVLPDTLRERGAIVEVVPVYRTSFPQTPFPLHESNASHGGAATGGDDHDAVTGLGDFDLITFTSSSTVTGFDRRCAGRAKEALAGKFVAAIGPITGQALEALGIAVDVMPADYTIDALVAEIEAFFANRKPLP